MLIKMSAAIKLNQIKETNTGHEHTQLSIRHDGYKTRRGKKVKDKRKRLR